jgi:hypothetical protein
MTNALLGINGAFTVRSLFKGADEDAGGGVTAVSGFVLALIALADEGRLDDDAGGSSRGSLFAGLLLP